MIELTPDEIAQLDQVHAEAITKIRESDRFLAFAFRSTDKECDDPNCDETHSHFEMCCYGGATIAMMMEAGNALATEIMKGLAQGFLDSLEQ